MFLQAIGQRRAAERRGRIFVGFLFGAELEDALGKVFGGQRRSRREGAVGVFLASNLL